MLKDKVKIITRVSKRLRNVGQGLERERGEENISLYMTPSLGPGFYCTHSQGGVWFLKNHNDSNKQRI